MKGKKLQPRTLYPARLSFRSNKEIKSFTDKSFWHHQTNLATNPKRTSLGAEEKATTRKKKLQIEKLTSKGKHTVKVGNHLYTNMISEPASVRKGVHKCRILEMNLKLEDSNLKQSCLYTAISKSHGKCKPKIYSRCTHKKEKGI